MNHRHNPELDTIKQNWAGTPVDSEGRFINLEFPFLPKIKEVLKWKFSKNPQQQEKKHDSFRLTLVNDSSFLKDDLDCIVWLGHATFFIRVNNVQLLIDPVFYSVPFIKRYSQHAFNANTFQHVDYLLISHDHQDHCQQKSIREVVDNNPNITLLTGLNMERLLRPWTKNIPIQTAGWYQQYKTDDRVELFFLPSRHWSKRGLTDDNARLWGAFVIRSQNKTIYFSGDTGYGNHFREARELFPDIDIAIVGVGAFRPEWFMHPNHVSPNDAVKGFNELGAKQFIPMHYGTFDVSDEPVGEPLRILRALEKEEKINGELSVLNLGEAFYC